MGINIISCADIHLRDSVPVSRTDDYMAAQTKKFSFLLESAERLGADIFCAGDLFQKSKSSSYLEAMAIGMLKRFKNRFVIIPGQHDLPNHNLALIEHSSLWVLKESGAIELHPTKYEEPVILDVASKTVVLIHTMVHRDKPIAEGIRSSAAR